MLQILRNKAQSTVIQAIVVIIALVFIFWGVGTNLMNNRESAITVNGEEISFQDYQRTYDQTFQRFADQFGGTLPKNLAESLGVKQQVINQLVQSALLRQGAQKMGIVVSEDELQNSITSMVQFQENGHFSMERYKAIMTANHMTPHKFETGMRHDMLSEKALRDIGKFAALASEQEVAELYQQDNEKIAVTYTRISPEQFKASVTVDAAALAKWFESVKQEYRSEPQLKLQYLDFSFTEVGKKIPVDEAQIDSYYRDNIASFTVPEKRHALHIFFAAATTDSPKVHEEKKARAEEIAKLARVSDDFAALARQYSEGPDKDRGGDLGFVTKGQILAPVDNAIFSMKPGEISEVLTTDLGYHIVKVAEIEPGSVKPLATVHDEIRDLIREKEAQALAFQSANSAYEGIIAAGSLQTYAEKHPEQRLVSTDFFTRSAPPPALGMDSEFLDKAFALKSGELSSMLQTPQGYYILFAEAVKEPETPTLEAVKEKATENFIGAKAADKARQTAETLLKQLHEGKPFATVVASAHLTMNDSGLIGRKGEPASSFPAQLTGDIFKLSKAEPLPAEPAQVDNDYYVYAYKERQIPEVTEQTDLQPYHQAVVSMRRQELLSAFIDNLQKDAKITVHKNL
ncbi:MAG: SurA N-terminal domain-containing protein [Desulfopila sp.]